MPRGRNNTLVPMCREERDFIASSHEGLVTSGQVQERLEHNAAAVYAVLRALDPEQALKTQRAAAIKTALTEWPSFRGADGEFVHLDPRRDHPSHIWKRVLQFRKERTANAEASEHDAERAYMAAVHREALDAGVPVIEETKQEEPVQT